MYVSTSLYRTSETRLLARFTKADDGAAAIEYGLVAFPLLGTVVFAMALGLALYLNTALQNSVRQAARTMMVGTVQSGSISASNYKTTVFCPTLPAVFDCSKVVLNIKVERTAATTASSTGYADIANSTQTALLTTAYTSGSATFCTGQPGDYIYLQAFYPLAPMLGLLSPASSVAMVNGKPAFLLMATAAFRNEQFSTNAGCKCVACSHPVVDFDPRDPASQPSSSRSSSRSWRCSFSLDTRSSAR